MASTCPLNISRYHFFRAEQAIMTQGLPNPPFSFGVTLLLSHCSLQSLSANKQVSTRSFLISYEELVALTR